MPVRRDVLFVLKPGFADPSFPGKTFFCWECAYIEGVLASFPAIAAQLEVRRIAWPRPREELVERVGEENQSCPVLVFPDGTFAAGAKAVVEALQRRHGLPDVHP